MGMGTRIVWLENKEVVLYPVNCLGYSFHPQNQKTVDKPLLFSLLWYSAQKWDSSSIG